MGMKGLIKVKVSVTGTHHGNERVDKGEGQCDRNLPWE